MVINEVRHGFSERLRRALDEAGYADARLNELGRLFDVSAQAVRKWLGGDAIPNSSRAPLVAERLGVRRAWLVDGEPPMRAVALEERSGQYMPGDDFTVSSPEFRLLNNYRSLPRPLQESVAAMVESAARELDKKRG